jgi:hypothetical protein
MLMFILPVCLGVQVVLECYSRRALCVLLQVEAQRTVTYEVQRLQFGEVVVRNQTFADMLAGYVSAGVLPCLSVVCCLPWSRAIGSIAVPYRDVPKYSPYRKKAYACTQRPGLPQACGCG